MEKKQNVQIIIGGANKNFPYRLGSIFAVNLMFPKSWRIKALSVFFCLCTEKYFLVNHTSSVKSYHSKTLAQHLTLSGEQWNLCITQSPISFSFLLNSACERLQPFEYKCISILVVFALTVGSHRGMFAFVQKYLFTSVVCVSDKQAEVKTAPSSAKRKVKTAHAFSIA